MDSKQWAAKVERAANDPERIKRRKHIAPALTVPRTVTYLPAEVLDAMEASETPIPQSHAVRAKELRAKFLAP